MKRLLISLTIVTVLIATIVMPTTAMEYAKDASVTVTEVLDISIADAGADGIQFGTLDPGDTNEPDVDQSMGDDTTPALAITINEGTNVSCNVSIKGTDFHGTIPITGASWALTHDGSKNPMSTSYGSVATEVAPLNTVGIWHFLTIPLDAAGGTHSSNFTYEIVGS